MMDVIEIRRATLEDASLVAWLGAKTFSDTFANTCTKEDMKSIINEYYNIEQVKKELGDKEDYYFLASQGGFEKGYCRIKIPKEFPFEGLENNLPIELKRLYILNDYHGIGIAKALMEHSFTVAKGLGCGTMYLSVWEYNFRAKAFYTKHGFKPTGFPNDFPIGDTPQTDYWYIKEL
jgi:ribosomal protein S18 acetylase RimI-like enzyme